MKDSRLLKRELFSPLTYVILAAVLLLTMILCICVGSVRIHFADTVTAIWNAVWGLPIPEGIARNRR